MAWIACGLCLVVCLLLPTCNTRKEHKHTNVILIVIESLRVDHLGCFGYVRNTSPNLDRLAKECYFFTQAFSPSSWTRTALASIVSSTWPTEHGLLSDKMSDRLADEYITIQEYAKQQGLYTGIIYTNVNCAFGIDQAFDSVMRKLAQRADKLFHAAVSWIEKHKQSPFFLYLHVLDPHTPYTNHPQFSFNKGLGDTSRDVRDLFFVCRHNYTEYEQAAAAGDATWAESISAEDLAEMLDYYDSEIAYMDHYIGRLIDYLKYRGLWQNSLVIVTADHGEEFLDHGGYWHGTTLYNELLRVPLWVHVPGMGQGICRTRVSTIDIFPTVMEFLAGTTAHGAQVKGRSLLPIIGGEKAEARRFIAATHFRIPRTICLIDKDYKLIKRPGQNRLELYNITEDPGETRDLSAHSALLKPMNAILNRAIKKGKRQPPRPEAEEQLDADAIAALKSLGYM